MSKMRVNKEALQNLMQEVTGGEWGQYREFAKRLDLDVGHLHRTINGKSEPGQVFFGKLMAFCNINELKFTDYIFLEEEAVEELPPPEGDKTSAFSAAITKTIEGLMDLVAVSSFSLETKFVIESHLQKVCFELDKLVKEQTP